MHNKHNKITRQPFSIFQIIIEYLFPPEEHKLSGKLFVSGEGALEFKFNHHPKHVFITFDNDCHFVPCSPCDPGQDDDLEWYTVKHKHHHILVIKWNVSTMRTIYWKVCQ